MSPAARSSLLAPAGLLVGPLLLVASTEAGQILPYLSCGSPWLSPAWLALPAALLSLGAGWVSWRASRPGVAPRAGPSAYPAAFPFVGRIAALASVVFAYALALQGLSSLLLSGCER